MWIPPHTLKYARTLAERDAQIRRLILTDETMPARTYCGDGELSSAPDSASGDAASGGGGAGVGEVASG